MSNLAITTRNYGKVRVLEQEKRRDFAKNGHNGFFFGHDGFFFGQKSSQWA
jgi:hypothetical protein